MTVEYNPTNDNHQQDIKIASIKGMMPTYKSAYFRNLLNKLDALNIEHLIALLLGDKLNTHLDLSDERKYISGINHYFKLQGNAAYNSILLNPENYKHLGTISHDRVLRHFLLLFIRTQLKKAYNAKITQLENANENENAAAISQDWKNWEAFLNTAITENSSFYGTYVKMKEHAEAADTSQEYVVVPLATSFSIILVTPLAAIWFSSIGATAAVLPPVFFATLAIGFSIGLTMLLASLVGYIAHKAVMNKLETQTAPELTKELFDKSELAKQLNDPSQFNLKTENNTVIGTSAPKLAKYIGAMTNDIFFRPSNSETPRNAVTLNAKLIEEKFENETSTSGFKLATAQKMMVLRNN